MNEIPLLKLKSALKAADGDENKWERPTHLQLT